MFLNFYIRVLWHSVLCYLRLHFARLFAAGAAEIVELCSPIFSVEVAVANGLGYVVRLYLLACFKVGNGAGYF